MTTTPVYTQLVLRPVNARVSGGDGPDDEGGDPGAAGAPTPPPASTPGGPAAGASNADLGVGGGDPVPSAEVMQAELRRARDEAAERRVALKRYEEAFSGYEPDEVDEALAMYRAITENPADAYARFQRTAENIRKHLEETGQLPGEGAEPKYLTREDLDKIESDRAQEAAVRAILDEAKGLGYEEGSAAHQHLLFLANKVTGGDLKKAHEQITAELEALKKAAVQEYVDGLGKSKFPPIGSGAPGAPAQGGAGAPAEGGQYSAKKSALARLTAMGF